MIILLGPGVSVNTVAIWPGLDAGLDELVRVLRPVGHALLSWQGGSAPSRSGASMQLTTAQLDRLDRALSARFATVGRDLPPRCTVFTAYRGPEGPPRSPGGPERSPRSPEGAEGPPRGT